LHEWNRSYRKIDNANASLDAAEDSWPSSIQWIDQISGDEKLTVAMNRVSHGFASSQDHRAKTHGTRKDILLDLCWRFWVWYPGSLRVSSRVTCATEVSMAPQPQFHLSNGFGTRNLVLIQRFRCAPEGYSKLFGEYILNLDLSRFFLHVGRRNIKRSADFTKSQLHSWPAKLLSPVVYFALHDKREWYVSPHLSLRSKSHNWNVRFELGCSE